MVQNKILKVIMAIAAIAAFSLPAISFAASMNTGSTVSVDGTTVQQGNAYAIGGMVTTSGIINGDLVIAGGTLISSSKVNGDIMAAGGTITMIGITAQDARIAGGNVTISGVLTGELMAAAGTLVIIPGTTIAKDSYIAGGSVNFSGVEAGNLNIAGGNVYFDGTTNGNLIITRAKTVTIGPSAVIKGTFEYSAPVTATINSAASIAGAPVFHQIQNDKTDSGAGREALLGVAIAWWFIKLLIVLTAAYLLWYLFRNNAIAMLDQSRTHYGKSLLHGFIFFFIVPISIIVAFVTVIGIIPGLIALFAYLGLLILGVPFSILFAAMLLKKGKVDLHWYHILAASIVIGIVGLIPFIGWIACALVYLAALGALINVAKGKFA